jgi:hypothetical protein
MRIVAGCGNDLLGSFNGNIDGDLRVAVGAGDNDMDLLSTSLIAGGFRWVSGSGNDTVRLAGTINGDAFVRTRLGDDSLLLEATAVIGEWLIVNLGPGVNSFSVDVAASVACEKHLRIQSCGHGASSVSSGRKAAS